MNTRNKEIAKIAQSITSGNPKGLLAASNAMQTAFSSMCQRRGC